MALLFCDSFDHYDNNHIGEKWDAVGSMQVGNAREGQGATSTNGQYGVLQKNVPGSSVLVAGAAFNAPSGQTNRGTVIQFANPTAPTLVQAQLVLNTDGSLAIHTNPGGSETIVGTTASGLLKFNVFVYLEFYVAFSSSGTGMAKVALNGQIVLSVANLTIGTSANASQVIFAGTDAGGTFDDVYICDGTGTINNNFLGDVRVAVAAPAGNGRVDQWARTGGTSAGNYTAVSELPVNWVRHRMTTPHTYRPQRLDRLMHTR